MLSNKAGNISWAVTSVLVWESYPFVGKSPWFGSVSLWSLPFDGRRWCCQTEARSCVLACVCVTWLKGFAQLTWLYSNDLGGLFHSSGSWDCLFCLYMGIMRFAKVKAIAGCIFSNMSEHDFAASNAGRFLSAKYALGEYVKYWLNSKLIYPVKK